MSKTNKKTYDARIEIKRLKTKRRLDVILCIAALLAIATCILAQSQSTISEYIKIHNIAGGGLITLLAFGLTILTSFASLDFVKCGHKIDALHARLKHPKKHHSK